MSKFRKDEKKETPGSKLRFTFRYCVHALVLLHGDNTAQKH